MDFPRDFYGFVKKCMWICPKLNMDFLNCCTYGYVHSCTSIFKCLFIFQKLHANLSEAACWFVKTINWTCQKLCTDFSESNSGLVLICIQICQKLNVDFFDACSRFVRKLMWRFLKLHMCICQKRLLYFVSIAFRIGQKLHIDLSVVACGLVKCCIMICKKFYVN